MGTKYNPNKINIHPFSSTSLYVEPYYDDIKLSCATAFVVVYKEKGYILTNWHVVSGVDPDRNMVLSKTGLIPNRLRIVYHSTEGGKWVEIFEPLYNETGDKLWIEHEYSQNVDVVALPFKSDPGIMRYAFNLGDSNEFAENLLPEPGMHVSIIGFPLGIKNSGYFPIWKGGYIATDPDIDFKDLPLILIDATTREGMSGSPVFVSAMSYMSKNGQPFRNGSILHIFLGIYSGRENDIAELGKVWKTKAIIEMLSNVDN